MKNIENKTLLCIISCVLMIIGIGVCFAVAIFGHEEKDGLDFPKVEEKEIDYVGTLEYSIGCDSSSLTLSNVVELDEDDVKNIYREYKKYTFKEIDKEIKEDVLYQERYIFIIDDIEIVLEPNSDTGIIDGEYYNLGNFYDYLYDFVLDEVEVNDVYLFNYTKIGVSNTLYSIDITDKDKNVLKSLMQDINYDVPEMNLVIATNYLLVVENTYIYIGNFDRYAMIDGKLVILPDEMVEILKSYLTIDTEECCSCCPDLEPGGACIEMCCPCSE